ncbi:MAG: type II secretion system protein [Bacilli bacterium]|nr:type II secretion system protein [Bacilli bacterium]
MNKKGFTLVELLAVITILGIVMLIAVVAVLPMIDKSEQKALIDEGKSLVKAAELAYANNEDGMRGKVVCVSMEYLYNKGYYPKGKSDGYAGSVYINDTTKKYIIANENGSFGYNGSYNLNNMVDFKDDSSTFRTAYNKTNKLGLLSLCGETELNTSNNHNGSSSDYKHNTYYYSPTM